MTTGALAVPPVPYETPEAGLHWLRASYTPDDADKGYYPSSSPNLLHDVEQGPANGGGSSPGGRRFAWIWILLLIVIVCEDIFAAKTITPAGRRNRSLADKRRGRAPRRGPERP